MIAFFFLAALTHATLHCGPLIDNKLKIDTESGVRNLAGSLAVAAATKPVEGLETSILRASEIKDGLLIAQVNVSLKFAGLANFKTTACYEVIWGVNQPPTGFRLESIARGAAAEEEFAAKRAALREFHAMLPNARIHSVGIHREESLVFVRIHVQDSSAGSARFVTFTVDSDGVVTPLFARG